MTDREKITPIQRANTFFFSFSFLFMPSFLTSLVPIFFFHLPLAFFFFFFMPFFLLLELSCLSSVSFLYSGDLVSTVVFFFFFFFPAGAAFCFFLFWASFSFFFFLGALCFLSLLPSSEQAVRNRYPRLWNEHRNVHKMLIYNIGIPKHKNTNDFLVQVRNFYYLWV